MNQSMEQNSSSVGNNLSASEAITGIYDNPYVHLSVSARTHHLFFSWQKEMTISDKN